VAFPLRARREPKAGWAKKVADALAMVELSGFEARNISQLSGGQRQRVALGRAIVRHPQVFLMDEPLSNLDALLRVQTREELLRLHRRIQGTVIYVTHDQVEAMTMGDRVVVMRDGIIHQLGEPQAVYDQPANTFVATFIGSPAMSLFRGGIQAENGSASFVAPALRVPLPGRLREALASHGDPDEVTLGIRSEHVLVSTNPGPDAIEARIGLIEPVGSDMFVSLAIGELPCLARTEPRTDIEEGQTVWLTFVSERIHLFDAEGRNVLAPSAAPVAVAVGARE